MEDGVQSSKAPPSRGCPIHVPTGRIVPHYVARVWADLRSGKIHAQRDWRAAATRRLFLHRERLT